MTLSTAEIKRAAAAADSEYTLLTLDRRPLLTADRRRMEQVARDTDAAMVYGDYSTPAGLVPVIELQEGSVRDDFDFGPVVLVNTKMLRQAAAEMTADYQAAGFYDLRLRLSRMAPIVCVNEPLSAVGELPAARQGEAQFDYVDPRNRASQIEMEQAFTDHLAAIGALVKAPKRLDFNGNFAVEASVIIPVRNRVNTIADAVKSALAQKTDFPFNVIVVDNHSTDIQHEKICANSILTICAARYKIQAKKGNGVFQGWSTISN